MLQLFGRFCRDTSGATAIEYVLIAALIAVTIISLLAQTGLKLNDKFKAVVNGLS